LANAVPVFRGRFIAYGPRTSSPEKSTDAVSQSNTFEKLLDGIASWRVPHNYFLHFYVVSVSSSLFWGQELVRRGPAFMAIASRVDTLEHTRSMTFGQLILCWCLMTLQGTRRLWESIALTKPSESKMWFVHWILGIGFYILMGISIWVEGIRMKPSQV
jgi:3-oxo-5-alpha-steroid 4-dehydrogenase 3